MRGMGKAYRPWACRAPDVTAAHKRTRKKEPPYCGECEQSPAYMLDYTVNNKRYRESSGATDYQEALRILGKRREDRRTGRPVAHADPPVSTGPWAYALVDIGKQAGE